jgi:DNA topoisomerase IB
MSIHHINGELWKNNELIKKKDAPELYKIIEKYPPPPTMFNVILKVFYLADVSSSLIYTGTFKDNPKIQYIYGKDCIQKRRDEKKNVVKKILKIWKSLTEDKHSEFGIPISILVNTFIRIGSQRQYKKYGSQGLLTLKRSNFTLYPNGIKLTFVGKKKQTQTFTFISKQVCDYVSMIKDDAFIFNISEFRFNDYLKQKYNCTAKEIRTFGVNYIFFYKLYSSVKSQEPLNITKASSIKKYLNVIIKETAQTIQHTTAISKNSYLIDDLESIFSFVIETINKSNKFHTFLNRLFN